MSVRSSATRSYTSTRPASSRLHRVSESGYGPDELPEPPEPLEPLPTCTTSQFLTTSNASMTAQSVRAAVDVVLLPVRGVDRVGA